MQMHGAHFGDFASALVHRLPDRLGLVILGLEHHLVALDRLVLVIRPADTPTHNHNENTQPTRLNQSPQPSVAPRKKQLCQSPSGEPTSAPTQDNTRLTGTSQTPSVCP
eukprot:2330241-Rhodomonas_salina.1